MAIFTAAPVVRKNKAEIGACGMTDFGYIYVDDSLSDAEYRTVVRHEQTHIWARHNTRQPCNGKMAEWIIATEMEIARNIYDEEDIATITAPRSRLKGSFLPDSIADLPPDLLGAEEIYQWLIDHPRPRCVVSLCKCQNSEDEEATSPGEPVDIEEIRAAINKQDKGEKSKIAAQTAYEALKSRPPSLTACIDAALRVRVVPEPSYRRPSRRQTPGIILKGTVSTPRPPHVEIFVDRSGSFTPEKTAEAEELLTHLLERYRASIVHDVWYFGGGSLRADGSLHGGDTPYHLVVEHLLRSRPKLAVVITDDDPCGQLPKLPRGITTLCIPVGAARTTLAAVIGAREMTR